ncbi:TusE/DsrC/DsvC family sulfur relay protein [Desulfovibrio inopinatus]|uniref:TusE/DsrC/DsvC family sulfur relay protein n=1 Tax=Desulfovibrio inopinatus TaxID=102109 RepID=UPI000408256A|nr:TusE/DsrC/DsvC family sulfur relay protein [Desulfovibrio inopinatus]
MTDTAPQNPHQTLLRLAGQEIVFDEEGYFMDDTQWTEAICRELAAQNGLTEMHEEHWRVLYAYRDYYAYNGRAPLNRDLKKATGMSVLTMERLFPGGLKLGARRLCGLPNPKTCQ